MIPPFLVDRILRHIETTAYWPAWLNRTAEHAIPRLMGRLTADALHAIQRRRLRGTLAYAADHSPFYREVFGNAGLRAADIRSVADLRQLPFTTATMLADWQRFLCVDEERIAALYTTSGTTGEPKRVYYTANDLRRLTNLATVWMRHLCPKRLVVFIALPTNHGLWIGMPSAQRIAERAGGLPIPIGVGDPREILHWMQRLSPNVIVSSPSYMAAFTTAAERAGCRTPLDAIFLMGELLTGDLRAWLEEYWHAKVYDIYGTTEAGMQSLPHDGCTALHLNDLHLVAEIVDPVTDVPADDGELVITTLLREGMPLLRYRTGDHVQRTTCPDGLPFSTLQILGRLDDLLVTGDMNLSGTLIAQAIAATPGVSGRVTILLDKFQRLDRITLQVEGQGVVATTVRQALYQLYPSLPEHIANGMLVLEIETDVSLDDQVKALRIIDRRLQESETRDTGVPVYI